MNNVKEALAKNLTTLRLKSKMTQSELAEKINYTDKSVSKWEHGDATPPIDVLVELTKIYGVSLDYLVTGNAGEYELTDLQPQGNKKNKVVITLLSVMVVWLIATFVFIVTLARPYPSLWQVFVCAVPISCIVAIVFNAIWGKRKWTFVLVSVLIWSILATVFVCLLEYEAWYLFLLGIPLQIATILWANLNTKKNVKK